MIPMDMLFGFEEKALVSLCLQDCSTFAVVGSSLNKDDFKNPEHLFLFEAFEIFEGNGRSWTWSSIAEYISKQEKRPSELRQPIAYLSDLSALSFSVDNLEFYVGRLLERRNRGLLADEIVSIQEALVDPSIGLEILLGRCNRIGSSLNSLGLLPTRDVCSENLWEELKKDLDKVKSRRFAGTGFPCIDANLTWGFTPGQLSLITGRPSRGKSLFRAHVQIHLAGLGIYTITISKEQSVLQEYMRLIAIMSGIPLKKLISVHLWDQYPEEEYEAMERGFLAAMNTMSKDWPHRLIRPHGYFGLRDVERYIVDSKMRGDNPQVVFIDLFAQLNDVDTSKPAKIEQKVMESAEMAAKHDIHVCLVIQQTRYGKDKDKIDHQEKFKGSGSYEERADLAFEIDRPAYGKPDEIEDNRMTVRILKQREGPTPSCELGFEKTTLRLFDPQSGDQQEGVLKGFGGFK